MQTRDANKNNFCWHSHMHRSGKESTAETATLFRTNPGWSIRCASTAQQLADSPRLKLLIAALLAKNQNRYFLGVNSPIGSADELSLCHAFLKMVRNSCENWDHSRLRSFISYREPALPNTHSLRAFLISQLGSNWFKLSRKLAVTLIVNTQFECNTIWAHSAFALLTANYTTV